MRSGLRPAKCERGSGQSSQPVAHMTSNKVSSLPWSSRARFAARARIKASWLICRCTAERPLLDPRLPHSQKWPSWTPATWRFGLPCSSKASLKHWVQMPLSRG
eukprot:5632686-Prymnesium_polylepis.1